MEANHKNLAFRLLFLIATPKLVKKGVALLKEGEVPVQYHFCAQGTASSEIMDMLGLGSVEKNILMCVLPKEFADQMLKKLRKELYLGMPNTGVAFTVIMSGSSGRLIQLIQSMQSMQPENGKIPAEREGYNMAEVEYSLIMAIVNQGFSENVMDAAKPMGATGGTVLHTRRIGSEAVMKFWNISVHGEREIVMILVSKEDKLPVMKAIGEKCGVNSEAQGVVLSLPVDNVVGLN